MTRLLAAATLALLLPAGAFANGRQADGLPRAFEWLRPWLEIGVDDRQLMDRREVLARVLPASGSELGVFFAGRLRVDTATFLDRIRDSEQLWTSEHVPIVRRFSTPPSLADLDDLRLDDADVDSIAECRPGACNVKLAAAEIESLRATIRAAGSDWRPAVQAAFRKVVFARVREYLRTGLARVGPFHDHAEPVDPLAVSGELVSQLPWLSERSPRLAEHLQKYPAAPLPGAESYLYWLRTTHTPKPTVQVIHVVIHQRGGAARTQPEVLVATRQVFATHYVNGVVSLSALLSDPADPSRRYLAYMNRMRADGLGGWLSGLLRFFVERRVRNSGQTIFELQRERIEKGYRQSETQDGQRRQVFELFPVGLDEGPVGLGSGSGERPRQALGR